MHRMQCCTHCATGIMCIIHLHRPNEHQLQCPARPVKVPARHTATAPCHHRYGPADLAELVSERTSWARAHLGPCSTTWLNIADWPAAMVQRPGLSLTLVQALAALPAASRPAGLMVEDPSGGCYPFEVGPWVAAARAAMLAGGWDGHLLVHMHHNYGLAQVGGLRLAGEAQAHVTGACHAALPCMRGRGAGRHMYGVLHGQGAAW